MTTTLLPIFSDHLSHDLPSLEASEPDDSIVLMMEVKGEAETVPHHRMKLAFIFSTMRHFAEELRDAGWEVDYVALDDPDNTHSFDGEMQRAIKRHQPDRIRLTEPCEYRVRDEAQKWEDRFDVPVTIMPDSRFVCSHEAFSDWAEDRKELRMEYFYREMRRKTGLLMEGDDPVGGQWNFDKQNRKSMKDDVDIPDRFSIAPDKITKEVLSLVETEFPKRFGSLDGFSFAVTRNDALKALDYFIKQLLPDFGDYQDAMVTDEPFLFHSLLSMYINAGLLDPLEVCERVEAAHASGDAPINAVEGYIRQIIGWREYVRGIYWMEMPDYVERNELGATGKLPTFYWDGETDMACVSEAVTATRDHAYAHHIQRLMITGNFALLAGIDPKEVHKWYLAVYADAYEWVELPNTLGMSQYGDGGLLASKPYASSGNYINKMSNYCADCAYDVKERVGEKACPFNALYWNFLHRNREVLDGNPRLNYPFATLDRMKDDTVSELNDQAERFLKALKTAPVEDYL